jgi:hypothetical protein
MKTLIPAALALALLSACASSRNADLDEKVSQESQITNQNELSSEVTQEIDSDASLTPDQKVKLKALHTSHSERLTAINKQFLELRAVLVKDLLAKNYNEEEVNAIKTRIRKNEDTRVTAMFEAVDKANAILGRSSGEKHRKVMRAFIEPGAPALDRE